jgi:hypothetical protein
MRQPGAVRPAQALRANLERQIGTDLKREIKARADGGERSVIERMEPVFVCLAQQLIVIEEETEQKRLCLHESVHSKNRRRSKVVLVLVNI